MFKAVIVIHVTKISFQILKELNHPNENDLVKLYLRKAVFASTRARDYLLVLLQEDVPLFRRYYF